MNTQQLESFIQVAENLNFARAAEVLNITQSAVSRQIRSLEEELDIKLLHRSTRTVSLTPAGISFLNDAKEVLAKLQMASQKLKSHSESNIQILSIGCKNETDLSILTEILYRCREKLPEIHPFLRIIPTRSILNLLIHGEIDILFGFSDDIPIREDLHYYELAQLPICCALPAGHPLSAKQKITENDLLQENIVICNSYEIPLQVANIQNHLSHQFLPNTTYYCENLQAMLAIIKAGYGFGILPETPSDDADIIYVPLDQDFSLSYGIFYKDISKNPTLKKFVTSMQLK